MKNTLSCFACVLCSLLRLSSVAAVDNASHPSSLLIVVPDQWRGDIDEYLAHEKLQQQTDVLLVSSALREDGVDDAEKIKRAIYNLWREGKVSHVLLIGEADRMPVRFMVLDRNTPAAFNYEFYPSDLYYADLAKSDGTFEDWNACHDDFHSLYFGEVRGEHNKADPINLDQVDYLPEIAIGRWPVRNPVELGHIAAKTIAYEQRVSNTTRRPKASFVGVSGWVDMRPRFEILINQFNAWDVKRLYFADRQKDYNTPPPTTQTVQQLFQDGSDLVVHGGHGDDLSWQGCLHRNQIPAQMREGYSPIVFSIGCSTARLTTLPPYENYLDVDGQLQKGTDLGGTFLKPPPAPNCYQPAAFNSDGLGKAFLRAPNSAALVYIGCNTGSQPCALTLADGFLAAIAEGKVTSVGNAWSSAIKHYYETERLADLKPDAGWYPSSIFFQGMKFMYFGDPTLPLPPVISSDLNQSPK